MLTPRICPTWGEHSCLPRWDSPARKQECLRHGFAQHDCGLQKTPSLLDILSSIDHDNTLPTVCRPLGRSRLLVRGPFMFNCVGSRITVLCCAIFCSQSWGQP